MASRTPALLRPATLASAILAAGCPLPSQSVGDVAETSTSVEDGGSDADAGPATTPGDDEAESAPEGEEGTDSATDASTTDPTMPGTSGSSPTTGAPECAEDLPPTIADECSVYAQDCPACYRCTWAKDGDGTASNQVPPVCVLAPEAGGAPGEPCTIDVATGNDDCEVGSFCYPPLIDEFMPHCVSFCASEIDFTCDVPDTYCVGSSSAGAFGCLQACDPLLQDCWQDEVCTLTYPTGDGFVCYPSGIPEDDLAGVLEECSSTFECQTGLICVEGTRLGPACTGLGCCTPYCDADDPMSQAECQSIDDAFACIGGCGFGSPPGYEHVGACLLDEIPPGVCPPDGADQTYPWCSWLNEDACGDRSNFGGGDECNDYCHCYLPCDDADDCDVPPTGNATPACHLGEVGESNSCVLECDAGQTCPDGMLCSDLFGWCMWATPTDEGC